nr:branched-chain amino acid transport system II carrier protein [Thalassobacillus sp. C254]
MDFEEFILQRNIFYWLSAFCFIFGAGNLIFPPFLGQEAGENYWTAILGFVVTGVGLPLLGIVAIALTGSSFEKVANKVTPLFAIIFTLVLYLAIGPFFGIPRAVNVSYEMGAVPFLPALESYSTLYLFLYSLVFFLIVYWLSLNPSKLVKRIGVVITPLLLFSIVLLVIGNVMTTAGSVDLLPTDEYLYSPFSRGMIEGYLTMDTIAALAFGLLIVNMIREKGIENRKSIVKATVLAGIIAGIGLGAVYIAIGWLGVQSGAVQTFENGTQILNYTADQTFGYVGVALLGFIVTLACLTTCVGLVTASAQYLARVLPSLSYGVLVLLITIVSFAVANLG